MSNTDGNIDTSAGETTGNYTSEAADAGEASVSAYQGENGSNPGSSHDSGNEASYGNQQPSAPAEGNGDFGQDWPRSESLLSGQQPGPHDPTDGINADSEGSGFSSDSGDAVQGTDSFETDAMSVSQPEPYEDFTLPEGNELNQQYLEMFTPLAQKHGLSQESAQAVVDMQVDAVNAVAEAYHEAYEKKRYAEINGWAEAAMADENIGGVKLQDSLATSSRALQKFASPAFLELLDETGIGNHPEMIRFALNVGQAFGEDSFPSGGNSASRTRSRAENLYPTMRKRDD